MFLVGYGDIYPRTDLGRLAMFFCSLVGVVVISVMVVAVTNKLEMDTLEKKVYTVMTKISLKEKMINKAAKVIGKAGRLYLNIKNRKEVDVHRVFELSRCILGFKRSRRLAK